MEVTPSPGKAWVGAFPLLVRAWARRTRIRERSRSADSEVSFPNGAASTSWRTALSDRLNGGLNNVTARFGAEVVKRLVGHANGEHHLGVLVAPAKHFK